MAPNESDSLTSTREPRFGIQCIPLSDAVLNLSYWCTVVLVAVVGGYVFHWRWIHPTIHAAADDPWGITTPPWIVEALFPVLMFGYLAEACLQALCGNRNWRSVGIATLVMTVVGLTQSLDALMAVR
jgi:hypothetical protein